VLIFSLFASKLGGLYVGNYETSLQLVVDERMARANGQLEFTVDNVPDDISYFQGVQLRP
jgi:hypothetical protein